MTFKERLEMIGFDSYASYLASPQWKEFKRQYQISGRSTTCAVCKTSQVELHHHTYERLGRELLSDVTPLCQKHHDEVHRQLTRTGKFVDSTQWAVDFLKSRLDPSFLAKQKTKQKRARKQRKKTSNTEFTEQEKWINHHFANKQDLPAKSKKRQKCPKLDLQDPVVAMKAIAMGFRINPRP